MRKIIDPFLYNVPQLDIHGYERTGAKAMIKMFIDENIRIENKKIIIVHGNGSGVLKNATHEYLKKDRRVLSFNTSNYNPGQTIVNLK